MGNSAEWGVCWCGYVGDLANHECRGEVTGGMNRWGVCQKCHHWVDLDHHTCTGGSDPLGGGKGLSVCPECSQVIVAGTYHYCYQPPLQHTRFMDALMARLEEVYCGPVRDVEKYAAFMHDSWAGWMEYLFGQCRLTESGEFVIPAEKVKRWMRQKETDYEDLPEEEKNSDRVLAWKLIELIMEGVGNE